MKATRFIIAACALLAILASTVSQARAEQNDQRTIKVLIITLFEQTGIPGVPGEASAWIQNDNLTRHVNVKGLSSKYPDVLCNDDGECLLTTDMGYANAATSVMALVLSDKFDLSRTYFVVAGIAGINPACGTLATPVWTRFAVDGDLSYELDAREMPDGWPSGYFALGSTGPGQPPPPTSFISTQIFRLNERLVKQAMDLSKKVKLTDSPEAQQYRSFYPTAPANKPPVVTQGDAMSGDVYWYGKLLADRATAWTGILTNGAGKYCVTDQEDAAVLTALQRGEQAGLLDFKRVAILRAGAGFDQQFPGRTAYDGLVSDQQGGFGGYFPSLDNLYKVGSALTKYILKHWDAWKYGVQ